MKRHRRSPERDAQTFRPVNQQALRDAYENLVRELDRESKDHPAAMLATAGEVPDSVDSPLSSSPKFKRIKIDDKSDDQALEPLRTGGPTPKKHKGWMAYSGLTFERIDQPVPNHDKSYDGDDEGDDNGQSPKPPSPMPKRRGGKVCPVCLSTRLIMSRHICTKCAKVLKVDPSDPASVPNTTNKGGVDRMDNVWAPNPRPQYELDMLKNPFDNIPDAEDQDDRNKGMGSFSMYMEYDVLSPLAGDDSWADL